VLANSPPPAASQAAPAPTVRDLAVADPAPVAKTPVATTPQKLAVLAPSPPVAAASSSSKPDKVEPPALPPAATSPQAAGGKTYSPKQVSANLLAEAVTLDRQGHQEEAKLPLQRALAANPLDLQARQMLIQLQVDTGQVEQARALLAEGQRLLPEQSNFTLALARLMVESGDVGGAIRLLDAGLANARGDPQYHAFLAALLLRVQRYDDAVQHYLVALRSDPANTGWLVGAGVAFEGVGNQADAAESYRRADAAANLTPEMANFLSERLARLAR
jgi:MSHA biogenesis protein MshN